MNRDLTTGKPETVLWNFCVPLFGSIIFQQLYNIADSFVAGKLIGENALAAVGNSYEITLIFIAFAFGCNIGCSVIVSQLFGAREYKNMKTAVTTSMIASAVLCAVLVTAGVLGGSWLLRVIRTPEAIFADSKLYLDIYTCFFIMYRRGFSRRWEIPGRRFSFWRPRRRPTSRWISCLSLRSIWESPAWRGQPFSARESAASWQ